MIKISNLKKSFGGQELFDNMSFHINKKERIGLVGRNGHGKTTLFKLILGELEPDEGEIHIPKHYRIGCLSQHLQFSKPTILEEACLGLIESEKNQEWKAKKILHGLGFSEDDFYKSPDIFSGGFQIRLNLAKVLLSQPDLLLLDEPNNYLDIIAIRWLVEFLKSWKNELMLITHDRHFMDSITTHTIAIHRKRAIKMAGSTVKLYEQINLEEDIYEKTRLNEEKKHKQTELFIRRFRAKARLAGMVQSRIKSLEKQERKEKLEELEELDFRFNFHEFPAAQMMRANNISFSYDNKEPYLINKFSIDIGKNERITVIGKNGKGKSTLLKLLAGEYAPIEGNIKKHDLLRIGYFSQTNVKTLNEYHNVLEELMSVDANVSIQHARDISGVLMFRGDEALKKIKVLSGGEKSRVALGKILVTPCNLLLLDEPTNHLDMESCDALLDAIESFSGSVIMVTHNEMYLERFAQKLVVFDNDIVNVYEKKYLEFLHDIGWSDEREDLNNKKKIKTDNKKIDQKKEARLKAEFIQEKSRVLNPIKKDIADIEQKIIKYEEEKKHIEQELIQASNENNGIKIAELSKKMHALKNSIDEHFYELEKKSNLYNEKEKEFNSKINDFN
jgi:ATP-binding cassette, subfamily F, member 3